MNIEITEGVVSGEVCNRDGCPGIIQEHEKDTSCSCHINPPCSHCTTDTAYCPECEWEAGDDVTHYEPTQADKDRWERENKERHEKRLAFWRKYHTGIGIDKLEIIPEMHTHFSMKYHCIFPPGTENIKTLYDRVKGSFGGRVEASGSHYLTYIAYTD